MVKNYWSGIVLISTPHIHFSFIQVNIYNTLKLVFKVLQSTHRSSTLIHSTHQSEHNYSPKIGSLQLPKGIERIQLQKT